MICHFAISVFVKKRKKNANTIIITAQDDELSPRYFFRISNFVIRLVESCSTSNG
jgi:hypothetical protein